MTQQSPLDTRASERCCTGPCQQWKHHSRFRSFRETDRFQEPRVRFASKCRDCEQIERNEAKNVDRPAKLMRKRTNEHAKKLAVTVEFLWTALNWRALVPVLRAMLTDEARCLSCGHEFVGERDVQIEHREPPRADDDWARQHARNIGLACQSCNGTKGDKPFAVWLDEQEDARRANETHRARSDPTPAVQLALDFGEPAWR